MFDWQFVTGTLVIAGMFGLLLIYVIKSIRKTLALKAKHARQVALEWAAAQQAAAEKAAREKAIADNIAGIRATAEQAAARRQSAERIAEERIAAEKNAVDQALAEWMEAEDTEARKAAAAQVEDEQVSAKEAEKKRIALDYALLDWCEKMQVELAGSGEEWERFQLREKKARKKVDAVKEQVLNILHQLEKETNDLEYIISTIQTGVDFLPIQVADTINKWKKGEIYRYHTLNDLKRKFRYMAYSIEDGWALHYVYSNWIEKLHNKLFVFAKLLGTEPDKEEDILSVISSTEQAEWEKHLKMDMEVIFVLKEMRNIHQMTVHMEHRLKELDTVCRKRSEQVIKPAWDPNAKG